MRKKAGLTTVSILAWSLGLMGCGGGEPLPSVATSPPPPPAPAPAVDTAVQQKADPVMKKLRKGAGPVGGGGEDVAR